MSCGEFRVLHEDFDEEAEAEAQHPNAVSPTQRYTQLSPPSASHTNPTYLLTAAAATMNNPEDPPQPNEGNNDNNNSNENETTNATDNDGGNSNENETANATVNDGEGEGVDPPADAAAAAASSATKGNNEPQEQPPFDVLTSMVWWRKSVRFTQSDALALIPEFDPANGYNPIFNNLIGDDLKEHVRHAIMLIQHILRIADHDSSLPDQIPPATDLAALSGMTHLMPYHQDLLELHVDRQYKPPGTKRARKQGMGGGGGGGDDKGGDDDGDGSDWEDDEDGVDPYGTDKTDDAHDDVTPPNSDKEKWARAVTKKRMQRQECKQWDVIRIVWDGLLHCYEMQISHLREHHLKNRNEAKKITQAMAELKKGKISNDEVRLHCWLHSHVKHNLPSHFHSSRIAGRTSNCTT